MKIIDLLNKIANGNIPKHIRYNDMYMTYDKEKENYYDNFGSEIDWKYTIMEYINDEIEIIEDTTEEQKKIPEKLSTWFSVETKQSKELNIEYANTNFENMYEKINEIIDYLDYLKSKGDE